MSKEESVQALETREGIETLQEAIMDLIYGTNLSYVEIQAALIRAMIGISAGDVQSLIEYREEASKQSNTDLV
jgi:hypothetical protein